MTRSLLLAGALLVAGGRLTAQADTGPPPRPKATDSARVRTDSAAADSAARDTIERYLPTFAPAIPPGPLPRGTRWRFDGDSLVLSDITTLADLLARIPGVYVVRGGWFGAAEVPVYGGQGPLALEVYWDGVPYLPLGRDSVWLDPARIPLGPLERVDVQVLPSVLRVYLVTTRPRSTVPRTGVRISTGSNSIAQYRGGFAKRWKSGLGLSLSADYRNLDGIEGTSTTAFNTVDTWLKAEYVPSPRFGVSYQILSSAWRRDSATSLVARWRQRRQDGLLRAFFATRTDGLGERVGLSLVRSRVTGDKALPDSVSPAHYQAILDLSETRSRASLGFTVRAQGEGRPVQLEGRAAWQPLRFLTLSADGRRPYYGGKGHGNRAHVSASLALPLGFSVRGEATRLEDYQAPLVADTFQWATDYGAYVRWDQRRFSLEAGQLRRDPFAPLGFAAGIAPVASLGPRPRSTYLSVYGSVRPLSGVELSGWYFDPVTGGGDFEPPKHARAAATFYSKFWRVFKSGVFSLRGEVAAESWSRSALGGRDTLGQPLPLGPATFVTTNIELRIADFTAYWITRNYDAMRGSYVSGLGYPKRAQYYGVSWFFRN
ncbi:MAG TPA: hypothetical protein VKO86_04730 [Gemmatimonadales bacterium]|nr:hypothetical protein [Gemmatimonadales bacterium]